MESYLPNDVLDIIFCRPELAREVRLVSMRFSTYHGDWDEIMGEFMAVHCQQYFEKNIVTSWEKPYATTRATIFLLRYTKNELMVDRFVAASINVCPSDYFYLFVNYDEFSHISQKYMTREFVIQHFNYVVTNGITKRSYFELALGEYYEDAYIECKHQLLTDHNR